MLQNALGGPEARRPRWRVEAERLWDGARRLLALLWACTGRFLNLAWSATGQLLNFLRGRARRLLNLLWDGARWLVDGASIQAVRTSVVSIALAFIIVGAARAFWGPLDSA